MKITVGTSAFGCNTRFVLIYNRSKNAYVIEEACGISYQKCSAIVRKYKGRYKKQSSKLLSFITFLNEENAKKCAEELNALLVMKRLGDY